MNNIAPPRPPPIVETDDEYDDRFPTLQPNQPIMVNNQILIKILINY